MTTTFDLQRAAMSAIGASPTEKHVLLVLALRADIATLRCTPGIARLASDTGLNERSVQRAIAALEAAGHIDRDERPGRGVVYTVHPRVEIDASNPRQPVTPDTESPPTESRSTPDTESPKLPITTIPPKPPAGGKKRAATRRDEREKGKHWTAPTIDHLPSPARAIAEQWPPGAYEAEAAGHSNWLASRRSRCDPNASWAARVVQLGAKPLQAGKAGLRYAPDAAKAVRNVAAAAVIARCGTAGEGETAVALRAAVSASVGNTAYCAWLEPCRFEILDNRLTIVAPSSFIRSYVDRTYGQDLAAIAARIAGGSIAIGWKVEVPA